MTLTLENKVNKFICFESLASEGHIKINKTTQKTLQLPNTDESDFKKIII